MTTEQGSARWEEAEQEAIRRDRAARKQYHDDVVADPEGNGLYDIIREEMRDAMGRIKQAWIIAIADAAKGTPTTLALLVDTAIYGNAEREHTTTAEQVLAEWAEDAKEAHDEYCARIAYQDALCP